MVCKKCKICCKRVHHSAHNNANKCHNCHDFYHFKCLKINNNGTEGFLCNACQLDNLPFSGINDSIFSLTLQGKEVNDSECLKLAPSFSIQTLLDQMNGSVTIETDEFLSDSIYSKYYTPAEFLQTKISKNAFTILHLNIASLQLHLDDLKTLLSMLNHSFSVIGITETKLKENSDTVINIDIDNYIFDDIRTKSHFGGCGIYGAFHDRSSNPYTKVL